MCSVLLIIQVLYCVAGQWLEKSTTETGRGGAGRGEEERDDVPQLEKRGEQSKGQREESRVKGKEKRGEEPEGREVMREGKREGDPSQSGNITGGEEEEAKKKGKRQE
jgi:hypothetical protein